MSDSPEEKRLPRKRLARGIWRVLQSLIVLGLVAFILYEARPGRLWSALTEAKPVWVLLAVAPIFLCVVLDSVRLYLLMRPHGFDSGFGFILRTNLVVNFTSVFLPGTIGGGAISWYRLSRPQGLRAQSFAALIALCVVGALAMAADFRGASGHDALEILLIVAGAAPLISLIVFLNTNILDTVSRFHDTGLARRLPEWLTSKSRKVLESLETYRRHQKLLGIALLAGIIRRAVGPLSPFFCLLAVDAAPEYLRIVWIMCAVEAVGMLPFSLSGFGLPQVTFVKLLEPFGIPVATALAANLLSMVALLALHLSGAAVLLLEPRLKSREASVSSTEEAAKTQRYEEEN